jgi:magnesium transporter
MKRKNYLLKTIGISKILPRINKPASSPGTVKYIGKEREMPVILNLIHYNEGDFTEKKVHSVKDCTPFLEREGVTWLNINGVHDEGIIQELGNLLKIHPLVLEDVANTTHNSKLEEYDTLLFTIIKMAYFNQETGEIRVEQVSLLMGEGYVISLQEMEGDILEGLRERIRYSKGKIRRMGPDYLQYAIIDAMIDNYFSVMERIGEEIEKMEEELIRKSSQELLIRIYKLKRELAYLRKSIWPMREVVGNLLRSDHRLIGDTTRLFMRDVYDHTIQVVDTVEIFRDMASGMLDLYLSTTSNRMNEIMKVLTIYAAIFIPLTFLSSVYGMNFKHMPELDWQYGYLAWWGAATFIALGLLVYFKIKKWL